MSNEWQTIKPATNPPKQFSAGFAPVWEQNLFKWSFLLPWNWKRWYEWYKRKKFEDDLVETLANKLHEEIDREIIETLKKPD